MLLRRKQENRRLELLPVAQIDSNPAQPRRMFEPRGIEQLAESIRENGLLCPISVRQVAGRYELVAGERRLMAFRLLERSYIPAIIEQMDDLHSASLALVENLQRSDLTFWEEALALRRLMQQEQLTQQQVAQRLGISQPTVANKLRLLRLPAEAVEALLTAGLTERHARALLPLCDDPSRLQKVVRQLVEQRPNVRQTERLVERSLQAAADRAQPPVTGAKRLIVRDLRLFTTSIGRAVELMQQAGIDATSQKREDAEAITYTIVIPKRTLTEAELPASVTATP